MSNPFSDALNEQASYSFGSVWTTTDKESFCEAACTLTNEGDEAMIGSFVFVNGIPQLCTDSTGSSAYIPQISMSAKNTTNSEITYVPTSNVDDSTGNVRYINIIEPGIIKSNDASFYIGFIHAVSGIGSAAQKTNLNKYDSSIDISQITGEYLKDIPDISSTSVSCKLNNETIPTVNYREDFVGNLTIEIASCREEKYILSFWGDGKPIKIGSNLYYELEQKENECTEYSFDILADEISSISNLYVIVCPVSDNNEVNIVKTDTIIISDEELTNTPTVDGSTDNSSDETIDKNNDYELSLGIFDGYEYIEYANKEDGLYNEKICKVSENGDILDTYIFSHKMDLMSNIRLNQQGIFITYDDNITILDNNFKLIYDGKVNEYFKDFTVDSDSLFYCIYNDNCYAYSESTGDLAAKNIKTGEEYAVLNVDKEDVGIAKMCMSDSTIIIEGVHNNGTSDCFIYIYNTKTEEKTTYDNYTLQAITPDNTACMFLERTSLYEAENPYVYILNIKDMKLCKVDFESSDETQNAGFSFDGKKIITNVYDENTFETTTREYKWEK